jgi:hypothetical protein
VQAGAFGAQLWQHAADARWWAPPPRGPVVGAHDGRITTIVTGRCWPTAPRCEFIRARPPLTVSSLCVWATHGLCGVRAFTQGCVCVCPPHLVLCHTQVCVVCAPHVSVAWKKERWLTLVDVRTLPSHPCPPHHRPACSLPPPLHPPRTPHHQRPTHLCVVCLCPPVVCTHQHHTLLTEAIDRRHFPSGSSAHVRSRNLSHGPD